jgi:hypothetical protein
MEPIAVTAKQGVKTDPGKFKSIEESLTWQMEFPGGILADCRCSYSEDMNLLHAEAEKGWFELLRLTPMKASKAKHRKGPSTSLR